MKIIELHGVLRDKFGQYFTLDVQTAHEATYALGCQLPEFRQFMLDAEDNGMAFAVFADDDNLSVDDIDCITDAEVIHIVPRLIGSGLGDIFQLVAGAILIGVGMLNPLGWEVATTIALKGAGIGLMVGGIAGLLMPTPTLDNQDRDGNRANKGFGGAVTTVAQGNVVAVLYGEREIGGAYGSIGIYSEDDKG